MNPDFDLIIIGSGPAGVSAAYPLSQSGMKILMIDGGQHAHSSSPTQPFLEARQHDPAQWTWTIGADFHALRNRNAVSPKLRVPGLRYVFDGFAQTNRIADSEFIQVGSLAAGGLSNAWGCGVARLSAQELAQFPCEAHAMEESYRTVTERIGVSGADPDDLSDYFGLDAWAQPPIELDALHQHLHRRYQQRRTKLHKSRFQLGRARVAALSRNHGNRLACNRSGNCLWGCHRKSLYAASQEIPELQRAPNFHYRSGFVAKRVRPVGQMWRVEGYPSAAPHEASSMTARKVLLAAGTLATTRLALEALQGPRTAPMLSCPTAAFLLWLPRLLGTAPAPSFGLGQLSFTVQSTHGVQAFGSTFNPSGIPYTEFARYLPLGRRQGVRFLRGLLSSCLIGNVFLPGHLSNAQVELNAEGSLRVKGQYAPQVPAVMADVAKHIRAGFRPLGAWMLPMSFTVGRIGSDIHYAGTLPMRAQPSPGQTDALGELAGLPGLHVIDGACLPVLTEKSHTLTIMANADRIGRALAFQYKKASTL